MSERIKSRFSNLANYFLAIFRARGDSEHEQALIRLVFGLLLLCYFFLVPSDSAQPVALPNYRVLLLLIGFIVISFLLILHISLSPKLSEVRRLFGCFIDTSTVTYFFFNADESAIPLYFIYLWVIFGNGFRFGRKNLYFALSLSLAGFGAALAIQPYWTKNQFLGWGLWFGMLIVSFYVGQLVERLTRARQNAEAANLAKRRFISSVTHELRTPLNAIIGMADLLRTTGLSDGQREMLDTLHDASRIMLSLVEDVLDFSKIEAGKLSLEHIGFDLGELVRTTADVFRYQAAAKNLSLGYSKGAGLPLSLVGDPHYLRQILVNLLSNAIKFTEHGGVTLNVSCIENDEDHAVIRFEVADTGIGMSKETQERIFESFAQADNSTTRRYGGTGLGTTIVKQLVELMGGQVGVVSSTSKGSVFWFEVGFDKRKGPSSGPLSTRANLREGSASQGAPALVASSYYKVLVAEDNPTNSRVIEQILKYAGHSYTLASNGEEALDRIVQEDFDVILLDMNMPVMSGLEVVKAYRFMVEAEKRAPVIMFTANVTTEAQCECFSAGVDAFLPKPIEVVPFLAMLDRMAGRRFLADFYSPQLPHPESDSVAQQHPSPSSPHVLDYANLIELESISEDKNFFDILLNGFMEDNSVLLLRLASELRTRRFHECRDTLHAIKGSAVSIGALSLRELCEKVEQMSGEQLARDTELIVAECELVFGELCALLDAYRHARPASQAISVPAQNSDG